MRGATKGGTLILTQEALGGNGGDSVHGRGDAGGDARPDLTFDDTANPIAAAKIAATVRAFGGNGGKRHYVSDSFIGGTAARRKEARM